MLEKLIARLKANPGYTAAYPPDPVKIVPPKAEPAEPTAFDAMNQVQELVEEFMLHREVTFGAHGKTWRLSASPHFEKSIRVIQIYPDGNATLVAYGSHSYQELTRRELAEVYIGQIMVGTRESGFDIRYLNCGVIMSDQDYPGYKII